MGRKPKKGVDYFSHDCDASTKPTLFTIQERFGNDGYAFWFKLLEFLGQRENLSFDCNVKSEWLFFVAKSKVSEATANDILDTLASIDAIDAELWKHRIVWSQNFLERVEDVYKKRGITPPTKPVISSENPHIVDEPVDEPQDAVPEPVTEEPAAEVQPEAPQEEQKPKRRKKTDEEKDAEKTKYADYVRMKPSEYDSLRNTIGKEATEKAIAILNSYKGSKGKTYKNDYMAIHSWVIDKIKKDFPNLIKEAQSTENDDVSINPFASYLQGGGWNG